MSPCGPNAVETHHIARSLALRYEILSCLIRASGRAHRFCHRFPREGMTACLLAKIRKGEYDRLEVIEVVGRDLVGVVANYEFDSEFWCAAQDAVLVEVDQ